MVSVMESGYYSLRPRLRVGQAFEKVKYMEEKSTGFGRACVKQ